MAINLGFADGLTVPDYEMILRPGTIEYFFLRIAKVFCATVLIESIVIYTFLRWPKKAAISLFFWILVVNLITNPAVQFGFLFLGDDIVLGSIALALVMICVIEFAVVLLEWLFFTLFFRRMHSRKVIDEAISAKRTVLDRAYSKYGELRICV